MSKYKNEQSELHKYHRQRLKKRFQESGIENFEPHVLLELLLFFSIPFKDTNTLAHSLLNEYGSIANILDAPFGILKNHKGVGEHTATLLKLIPQFASVYMSDKQQIGEFCNTPEKLQEYFAPKFIGKTVEVIFIAALDDQLRIVACKALREGDFHQVDISFQDVYRFAMQYNVSQIALAHNHPLALAQPSRMDQIRTKQLAEALQNMEIELIDHIIVGKNYQTFSMSRGGMLFGI